MIRLIIKGNKMDARAAMAKNFIMYKNIIATKQLNTDIVLVDVDECFEKEVDKWFQSDLYNGPFSNGSLLHYKFPEKLT